MACRFQQLDSYTCQPFINVTINQAISLKVYDKILIIITNRSFPQNTSSHLLRKWTAQNTKKAIDLNYRGQSHLLDNYSGRNIILILMLRTIKRQLYGNQRNLRDIDSMSRKLHKIIRLQVVELVINVNYCKYD